MTEKGGNGWSNRDRRLEDFLRANLSNPARLHRSCGLHNASAKDGRCAVCRYTLSVTLPEAKLDLIFRLMHVLTAHYRAPHLFPKWVTMLAKREALGSTGLGHGFGLLHQFQDDGVVQLANASVDWWLVLFPGGIEWGALDDKPVFGMIGHVFSAHHLQLPGLKLRTWALASHLGKELGWERVAQLDRRTAANVVNRATSSALQSVCQPGGHRT
jgi:mannitol/fructose-specific phosphotransferase system IIA component